jgi:Domain of unknown function (DUF4062)
LLGNVMSCIVTMCSPSPRALHSIDTSWARAEVFISATTRELRSYREEVKNALLTLGIFPIEQTNFRLAHGPLTAKLRSLIAPCDAVIHLAGFYYGAEPSQRPSGEPRRFYTQIEYDVARELRNPLFLFLAAENCGFDDSPEQSEEERTLQLAHRRAIEECDDVYYSFANHEDLARLVHCICCFFTMRLLINNTTRRIRRSQQDGVGMNLHDPSSTADL